MRSVFITLLIGILCTSSASLAQSIAPANWTNSCEAPWGVIVHGGESVTAYQSGGGSCESCQSEARTCNGGVLSGTYSLGVCNGGFGATERLAAPAGAVSFGSGIDISGDRVAISDSVTSKNCSDCGDITIFDYNTKAILYTGFAGDGGSDDEFAGSIALDGDYLIAGDEEQATFTNGEVALFNIVTGTKLTWTSDSGGTLERLGKSVDIDLPFAVAAGDEGRVIVFNVPAFTVHRKITPGGQNDDTRVAMEGELAIIGWYEYASPGGHAALYNVNTGALIRSFNNPTPADSDQFGLNVGISGDKVVISAAGDDTAGTDAGAIYVFNKDTGALLQTILNPNPANTYWPRTMKFDGNYIVVGAYNETVAGMPNAGKVYIFNATTGVLIKEYNNPTPLEDENFGSAIAISGDRIVIGSQAEIDTATGLRSGAAYWGGCGSSDCILHDGALWVVGGKYCTATGDFSIPNGGSDTVTDTASPHTGSSTWTCSDGDVTYQPTGATCTASYPSGSWNLITPYPWTPQPTSGGTALEGLADGRILKCAGYYDSENHDDCDIYDPSANTWTGVANLPASRKAGSITRLGAGRILYCGGASASDTGEYNTCYVYTVGTNSWAATANLHVAKKFMAATMLNDGRGFVCGGTNDSTTYPRCDLFNPATSTFAQVADIPAPSRYGHHAATLPDGRVLVCGGKNASTWYADCHLYNPANNTWAATTSRPVASQILVMDRLPSGKILLCGGAGSATGYSRCDTYNSADATWTPTADIPAVTSTSTSSAPLLSVTNRSAVMGDGRIMYCPGNVCYGYSE